MPRRRIPRVALALVFALPIAAAAEEGIQLKQQRFLLTLPPVRDEPAPVFMEADTLRGEGDKVTEAEGNVVLRRLGQSFAADWMRYETQLHVLEAKGNIRAQYGGDQLEGERLRINLGTERGFLEKPSFVINPVPPKHKPPEEPVLAIPYAIPRRPPEEPLQGRGSAERLLFQGPDRYRVEQSSYTTCGPGNDDWFIKAREMDLDKSRNVGVAHGASLVFLDHTIFYTPYISFPLQRERKSGLLTPHYGSSTTTGAEFTAPYYWNIAPQRDATFYPRVMSKRGFQLGTEFRYLDPGYSGEARVEYLPDDRQVSENRYGYFFKHAHKFANDWNGALNLNRVSDDKYFTDLSTLVAVTSRTTLPTEALLAREGRWGDQGNYAFSALGQRWQTLQTDPLVPITPPYNRLPQLTFTAFRQEVLGGDFDLLSSYVQFEHPTLLSGKRALAYPNYALPLQAGLHRF